jgi:folylpolyglutamate synthase/dihydropteroate synthase
VDALGGSIESIAAAKAGIIKQGRPVVIARQQSGAARDVVLLVAKSLGAQCVQAEAVVSLCRWPSLGLWLWSWRRGSRVGQ